jgi:hypothetical protein
MSDIKIDNISGSDLFNDSESFMVEISDDNEKVTGGITPASISRITDLITNRCPYGGESVSN